MINLENPIVIILGLVGALFSVTGLAMYYKPPKEINAGYGYRTPRAMKGQQSWDFAQKLSSKYMIVLGVLCLFLAFIALFIHSKQIHSLPIGLGLPLVVILGGCIFMFFKVEKELKEKFNTQFTTSEKSYNKSIFLAPLIPLMVCGLVIWGTNRENKIVLHENAIEIQHTYGEIIPFSNIKNIELVNRLPKIKRRKNGSVGANTLKGNFETYTGNVKLILNGKKNRPFLKIEKHEGETVYFSYKEDSVEPIFQELKQKIAL